MAHTLNTSAYTLPYENTRETIAYSCLPRSLPFCLLPLLVLAGHQCWLVYVMVEVWVEPEICVHPEKGCPGLRVNSPRLPPPPSCYTYMVMPAVLIVPQTTPRLSLLSGYFTSLSLHSLPPLTNKNEKNTHLECKCWSFAFDSGFFSNVGGGDESINWKPVTLCVKITTFIL